MDSQYWVVAMTVNNHGISNKKNGQQDLFPDDTPGALPHVDEGPDEDLAALKPPRGFDLRAKYGGCKFYILVHLVGINKLCLVGWFGTYFVSPYIGNVIILTDELIFLYTYIFFRGVG